MTGRDWACVARRRLNDRQPERPELLSDLKTRLIGAARMRTAKHIFFSLLHALWIERLFVGKVAVIASSARDASG